MVEELIFKKRFLEKYLYLRDNASFIGVLYNLNYEAKSLLKELENLLLSNDDLKDNDSYKYFEKMKFYREMLEERSFNEWKIREWTVYDDSLKELKKDSYGYDELKDFYKKLKNKIQNTTLKEYLFSFNDFIELDLLANYIFLQKKDEELKEKKLKIINEYFRVSVYDNTLTLSAKTYPNCNYRLRKSDNYMFVLPNAYERDKNDKGIKKNKFIDYFGTDDPIFNMNDLREEIPLKRVIK